MFKKILIGYLALFGRVQNINSNAVVAVPDQSIQLKPSDNQYPKPFAVTETPIDPQNLLSSVDKIKNSAPVKNKNYDSEVIQGLHYSAAFIISVLGIKKLVSNCINKRKKEEEEERNKSYKSNALAEKNSKEFFRRDKRQKEGWAHAQFMRNKAIAEKTKIPENIQPIKKKLTPAKRAHLAAS